MDTRNLQVHSKFYLIETADGNLDSSKSQDLALDVCVDIDKTGQCSSSYKNSCHECSVARLCRKTCGLCPGDGGHGNCFDVDAEGQCDQYKDKCHNGCVAKNCKKTCGICTGPSTTPAPTPVTTLGPDDTVPICPAIDRPVCGTDGKTYGNQCELENAGVQKLHDGECLSGQCPWEEEWSPCSVTCGIGERNRGRACSRNCRCTRELQLEMCSTKPCPGPTTTPAPTPATTLGPDGPTTTPATTPNNLDPDGCLPGYQIFPGHSVEDNDWAYNCCSSENIAARCCHRQHDILAMICT